MWRVKSHPLNLSKGEKKGKNGTRTQRARFYFSFQVGEWEKREREREREIERENIHLLSTIYGDRVVGFRRTKD